MKKVISAAALILLSLWTAASASEKAPVEKSVISYDSYLQQVSASLPEIKANGISLMTAENTLRSAQGAGNTTLTSDAGYSSATVYGTNPSQSTTTKERSGSIGLSKKIVSTGTQISGTTGYARDEYSTSSGNSYTPTASLKITQPLLYNFLGKVDSFAQKDAAAQIEIEKVKLGESNKSTLNAYKKLYFQWELYRRVILNNEDSVSQAGTLSARVSQNLKAGLTEEYSYQQTVSSLLSYKGALLENKTSLRVLEKQLGVYLDTSSAVPDAKDFDALYEAAYKNEFHSVAFESTESARIINQSLSRYAAAQNVYANKLLPVFDLTGGVTQKKNSSTDSISGGRADTDYNVGFSFTYTFGNDAAEADLQTVKIKIKDLSYEYDRTANTYRKNLLGYQENASGSKELLRTKEEQLKALTLQLASQRKKYTIGTLAISDLITTENSLSSVKNEILTLKYSLIGSYIDYCDLVK